jgi:hypothetical protein
MLTVGTQMIIQDIGTVINGKYRSPPLYDKGFRCDGDYVETTGNIETPPPHDKGFRCGRDYVETAGNMETPPTS